MGDRNGAIDVARGLGILLVVLGHNPVIWEDKGELYRVMSSFRMPLFFFLSGVFFRPDKPFFEIFSEKSDSLLKPYLVTLLSLGALGSIMKGSDFSACLVGILQATGESIEWTPLWFLPHLFVVTLFSWLFVRALSRWPDVAWVKGGAVAALLFAGIYTIQFFWRKPVSWFGEVHFMMGLPWSLDILLITSAYYLAGYHLSRRVRGFAPKFSYAVIAFIVFCVSHIVADQTIDLNIRKYDGYFFPVVESLSGIYLALALCHHVQYFSFVGRVFAMVGNASLFVLIFHWPIQGKALNILGNLLPNHQTTAMLLAFFVASLLPVAVWWVVDRSAYLSLLFLPFKKNKLFRNHPVTS